VGTYANALWFAQHEPTVPCSGLRGGQQQQMMPPGPTSYFQMAQGEMNMKMMLNQFMQGFIQYAGQQQQNQ
jgi:hypothetical protein